MMLGRHEYCWYSFLISYGIQTILLCDEKSRMLLFWLIFGHWLYVNADSIDLCSVWPTTFYVYDIFSCKAQEPGITKILLTMQAE
jgi:hypothetical protein